MTKKLVNRYWDIYFNGLTIEEAIKGLEQMAKNFGKDLVLHYQSDNDEGHVINYKSEETDEEYSNRLNYEEKLKLNEIETLKKLKAKYES